MTIACTGHRFAPFAAALVLLLSVSAATAQSPAIAWRFQLPGQYVPVKETVRGVQEILDGKHDNLPEGAFYNIGPIEQAAEKAAAMASQN